MKIKGIEESVYIFGLRDESGDKIKVNRYAKIRNFRTRPDGWNDEGLMDKYIGKYVAINGHKIKAQNFEGTGRTDDSVWNFNGSDYEFTASTPEEFLTKAPEADRKALAAQLGISLPKEARSGASESSTTSAPKKGNFMSIAESIVTANKAAAAREAQRQLGKVILGQLETRLSEKVPETVRPILSTPVGKYILANFGLAAASFYTGAQKDKISYIQDALMAAAASEVGDSLNINGLIDGVIDSIGAPEADAAKTDAKAK